MINYNSFTGIDFICDSQGCYSVNTALIPSKSTNSICLPSDYVCSVPDYITSAFALTSEEDYENLLNQAYSVFQQLILASVPYIALYLDGQKAKAEISKFIEKYLPNLRPQSIDQSLNKEKIRSIDENLEDETSSLAIRLKTIQDEGIVVGKDIANVTLASLKFTNALFPINTVTTVLQSEKIFTSLKKSKELYTKGNKKIDLSERLAKFGATALKMILPKKFMPGKLVTQTLSVTSSSLGYFKNIASKKKDLNFLLTGILLLGGLFKLENMVFQQFAAEEQAA